MRYFLSEVTAIAVTLGGFNPDDKGVQRPRMMGSTPVTATKDEDLI
ncbi:hypothetical protein MUO98_01780 [Candidatus Bathyarchaeota archaeon]|nr:hypothetical protein [Candidatus Bathyarchaeota archaeon]